ncbi:hypothetical protein EJB05_50553, partial [Eragrostis curvula]
MDLPILSSAGFWPGWCAQELNLWRRACTRGGYGEQSGWKRTSLAAPAKLGVQAGLVACRAHHMLDGMADPEV